MDFASRMRRSAVRAAVQRAIFCGTCEGVLDLDRAVLVENVNRTGRCGVAVCCTRCWDSLCVRLVLKCGEDGARACLKDLEVWHGDGREIVSRDGDEVLS